ncbi:MAG: electron transport complex subunit RsxE [Lachnospiraceae bacterium]|nr:electron transport complex subunit RsxE [Lachnospiraceae bacterium]
MSEMSERFLNGVFKENPTFVLLLGMCPTLAVTTSAANGLGMGITTLVVLAMSNLFISLLRKVIPDKIRIPAFIVIIASFVTMVELLLNAYLPGLYKNLGLYIPLIVVNCIILGRAEAYAYSHSPLLSLFDGLGMGTGFTLALTIIGAVRELLGTGSVFDYRIMPKGYVPVSIFIMAPGAFFVLALLTAIQNKIKEIGERKGKDMSKIQSGCGHDCLNCNLECATPEVKAAALKAEEPEVKKEPEPKAEEPAASEAPVATEPEPVPAAPVAEEPKAEEVSSEEPELVEPENPAPEPVAPAEETPAEAEAPVAEPEPVEEPSDETPASEPATESAEVSESQEEEIEFLDFSDLKKAIKSNTKEGKKPVRKKASLEKAKAMLEKAEESLKEEQND